jgi:hypothetical protein
MSGYELQKLVDQLNHEDRLEKTRIKRRGDMTEAASGATLIEIRNEIRVQAAETGKWEPKRCDCRRHPIGDFGAIDSEMVRLELSRVTARGRLPRRKLTSRCRAALCGVYARR